MNYSEAETSIEAAKELLQSEMPDHDFNWTAQNMCSCPHHEDRKPSCGIYTKADGIVRIHCFSCGRSGKGAIGIIAFAHDVPFQEAVDIAINAGYINPSKDFLRKKAIDCVLRDFLEYSNNLLLTDRLAKEVKEYVLSRGIPEEIIAKLPIGYYPSMSVIRSLTTQRNWDYNIARTYLQTSDPDIDKGSLIFFYKDIETGFLVSAKARAVTSSDPKHMIYLGKPKKTEQRQTFGYFGPGVGAYRKAESATIMEGEFDVMHATASRYNNDHDELDELECYSFVSFSGGGQMLEATNQLLERGVDVAVFPDNDEPGLEYLNTIVSKHPDIKVVIPDDMQIGDDPDSYFANNNYEGFTTAYSANCTGLEWFAKKCSDAYNESVDLIDKRNALIEASGFAQQLKPLDFKLFAVTLSQYSNIEEAIIKADFEQTALESKFANCKYLHKRDPANFGTYIRSVIKKETMETKISDVILSDRHDVCVYSGDWKPDKQAAFTAEVYDRGKLLKAEVIVPIDIYSNAQKLNSAIAASLGSAGVTDSKNVEHLRRSLVDMPSLAENTTARSTLGWNENKDEFFFSNKVITASGVKDFESVKVINTPEFMKNYSIRDIESDSDFNAAQNFLVDMLLKCFPYKTSLPLFVFIMASVVYRLAPEIDRPAVMVLGETNTFKTSVLRVFMNFYGTFSTKTSLMSWSSTHTAINEVGFYPKDLPYPVDDCKPEYVSPQHFVSIIQNYGDNVGKSKCTIESDVRTARPIQGALIMTGEALPSVSSESAASRMAILKLDGPADEGILTECQKFARTGLLNAIGIRWIKHFIEHPIDPIKIADKHSDVRTVMRRALPRVRGAAATLIVVWDLLKEVFPRLTELDIEFHKAVDDFCLYMDISTNEMTVGVIFTKVLQGLLADGTCIIVSNDSVETQCRIDMHMYAKAIGWECKDFIYILPDTAVEAVQTRYRSMTGETLKITATKLYDELYKNGLIVPDSNQLKTCGSKTYKARPPWQSDKPTNVLRFHKESLIQQLPKGVISLPEEEINNMDSVPLSEPIEDEEGTE